MNENLSPMVCIDGKRHKWECIGYPFETPQSPVIHEERWCKKCGSRTEFVKDKGFLKKWNRCLYEGNPYIAYPSCHGVENNEKRSEDYDQDYQLEEIV